MKACSTTEIPGRSWIGALTATTFLPPPWKPDDSVRPFFYWLCCPLEEMLDPDGGTAADIAAESARSRKATTARVLPDGSNLVKAESSPGYRVSIRGIDDGVHRFACICRSGEYRTSAGPYSALPWPPAQAAKAWPAGTTAPGGCARPRSAAPGCCWPAPSSAGRPCRSGHGRRGLTAALDRSDPGRRVSRWLRRSPSAWRTGQGNYRYRAGTLHRPSTLEQVEKVVAAAPGPGAGSRHSMTDLADSDELVSLEGLPADVAVDRDAGRSASLLACGTASSPRHSSARGWPWPTWRRSPISRSPGRWPPPPTARGRQGQPRHLRRRPGAGHLLRRAPHRLPGATTSSTAWSSGSAPSVPSPASPWTSSLPTRSASGCSRRWHGTPCTSTSTRSPPRRQRERVHPLGRGGRPGLGQGRVTSDPEALLDELFGAAAGHRRPAPDHRARPGQLHRPAGRARPVVGSAAPLPHGLHAQQRSRAQCEYLIPRRHAVAAIQSVHALAGLVRPLLQVSEVRTVAADRLWMSPQYGQDTIAIHFTWHPDPVGVQRALVELEAALAPSEADPTGARSSWPTPPPSAPCTSACPTSGAWSTGSTRGGRSATPG